jgi:hypothetical protein
MYSNIENLLHTNLKSRIEPALSYSGHELVGFYINSWKAFRAGAKYNAGVLHYMTRNWVMRERAEGRTDVFTYEQLHAVCWKVDVFEMLKQELEGWVRGAEGVSEEANLESFRGCYEELSEELKGTGEVMVSWEDFCRRE